MFSANVKYGNMFEITENKFHFVNEFVLEPFQWTAHLKRFFFTVT
jgi:hypothetical protein